MGLCDPLQSEQDVAVLMTYLQDPLFNLAEGSYPFPSDYITYATFNGSHSLLPPWPVRKLCEPVADSFGVSLEGDQQSVRFTVSIGRVSVSVDWDHAAGNGYSAADLEHSGALKLLAAVAKGAQVWYNVTGEERCVNWHDSPPSADSKFDAPSKTVDPTPPSLICTASKEDLNDGLAWGALCCNEGINLVSTSARGLGRDLFWPPSLARNWTLRDVVHGSMSYCESYKKQGFAGLPEQPDEWGRWLDVAYGGKRIEAYSNIFFSNGDLDPWTAAGVPAPGPTADLVAALIHQGGHHLDLFFSTEVDPESVRHVREMELTSIAKWIEARKGRDGKAFTAEADKQAFI